MSDKRFERLSQIPWFSRESLASKSAIVIGSGALGNWLLPHLVLNGIGCVLIVDKDVIEESNLPRSPLFTQGDIGEPKARVAARKLRSLDPEVSVHSIVGDVQWDVGLANFKYADVVCGAVDSRLARLRINHKAWVTNTPFIDGGIDGPSLTGRIRTFIPRKGACLECSMYPQDYELLEREYPCTDDAGTGAPTMSTIAAVTSSLEVNEALKLLLGMEDRLRAGCELRWDLMHNTFIETQIPRRSGCYFDHDSLIGETIVLTKPVDRLTLSEVFELAAEELGAEATLEFSRDIVTALVCENCGDCKKTLRVLGKISRQETECRCFGRLHPLTYVHSLTRGDLEVLPYLNLSLSEIGIPSGDIISAHSLGSSEEIFIEFVGALTKNGGR
ncbi:MAG: ThiF family adenylyltransferase [Candidatus Glassbacteria bacterium]